jgi:spermidine synthase
MGNWLLYLIVSISGAAVLAIEILGTRVLAPYYGASLFLWSALISVTLAALSAGYAAGGRWADRDPRLARVGYVLAAAGIWMLLVPLLRRPVLELVEPLGLRAAVLLAAFVLFAPPLALLGMVSPYAIKLRAQNLTEVGRAAGNIYAVGTVASVVAAIATGFFLIPSVGVRRLLVLIGLLLLIAGALAMIADRRSRRGAIAPILCLALAGLAGALMPGMAPTLKRHTLAFVESPYAELRVFEKWGQLYLILGGSQHTIVDQETMESVAPCVVATDVIRLFDAERGRALVVGLGGGSVAKRFAASHWQVDAVEIDPDVIALAHGYFGLRDDEAEVECMDARQYLRTHAGPYKAVVLDAYGSGVIPFHLVTDEYFELVKSRLVPDGIVAVNLQSLGWDTPLVRSVAATLRRHFRNVIALPTQEPPDAMGNVVLLVSDRDLELPENTIPNAADYIDDDYAHWMLIQMNHAWDNRFEPKTEGAQVLTDDRNPVELWSEAVNLAERQELHRFLGENLLAW